MLSSLCITGPARGASVAEPGLQLPVGYQSNAFSAELAPGIAAEESIVAPETGHRNLGPGFGSPGAGAGNQRIGMAPDIVRHQGPACLETIFNVLVFDFSHLVLIRTQTLREYINGQRNINIDIDQHGHVGFNLFCKNSRDVARRGVVPGPVPQFP